VSKSQPKPEHQIEALAVRTGADIAGATASGPGALAGGGEKAAAVAAPGAGGATVPAARRDRTRVRPYGDTWDDGAVQLSFTLPVGAGPVGQEAARQLATKIGFEDVKVVSQHDLGGGFAMFVVYGKTEEAVDLGAIEVPRPRFDVYDFDRLNEYVRRRIGRKLVVVGACTGTDAHTIGLDAIMNIKGYAGHHGLESYPEFEAHNLGSQVANETLVARAMDLEADAILVSQVVTEKDIHVPNLTQLVEMLEAEGFRDEVVLVCGGPRISHELAVELGFDAGFGPGTLPPEVASFIAQEVVRRGLG
jgi:beta-lysine 5,6-aminomutase beta subunit